MRRGRTAPWRRVAPPIDRLRPELRPAVAEAHAHVEKYNRELGIVPRSVSRFAAAEFLRREARAVPRFGRHHGRPQAPLRLAVDDRITIRSSPPIEFFDRAEFPWLDAHRGRDRRRSATNSSRVLARRGGVHALHLVSGRRAAEPVRRAQQLAALERIPPVQDGEARRRKRGEVPTTMKALAAAPQPDQPGRTPASMFSLLKPRTRIPPHTGVTNVRLVTHLPLIIPENCGFRVGNDTRQWVPGDGVGVRRHDRARSLERQRQAPRRAHLRRLASAPHISGAGDGHGIDGRHQCLSRGGSRHRRDLAATRSKQAP